MSDKIDVRAKTKNLYQEFEKTEPKESIPLCINKDNFNSILVNNFIDFLVDKIEALEKPIDVPPDIVDEIIK